MSSSSTGNVSKAPPRTADLTETWAFLSPSVDHIMTGSIVNYKTSQILYTAVYNCCKSTDGGSGLYHKLTEYFTIRLVPMKQAAASLQDEELLRYYADEWTRYTTGANNLNRIFTYINRYWVKRERAAGKKDIYKVSTLALSQWKSQFFVHVQKDNSKLTGAILRLIERQRKGDAMDEDLVKTVVLSFVSLGIDNTDPNKECLDVYKEHFETPFIQATELYYKKESEAFVAENTVSEYLKLTEERLREEEDRAERYLHTKTRRVLIAKCEDVLIRQHAQLVQEKLLDSDQDEDLQRMHALLARIPDGLAGHI